MLRQLGFAGRGIVLARFGRLSAPTPPPCLVRTPLTSLLPGSCAIATQRLLSTAKGLSKGRGAGKPDDTNWAARIRSELARLKSGGQWQLGDKQVNTAMGEMNR